LRHTSQRSNSAARSLHRDGLSPSAFCRSPGAPVHTWPKATDSAVAPVYTWPKATDSAVQRYVRSWRVISTGRRNTEPVDNK
jgi:hypothetical protein